MASPHDYHRFVDGTDLEKKARDKILSCREAAEICKEIAEALQYAHQNGVIHRDIKPQNILIGSDGKPRITDFGLAKLANQDVELTGSGQIMGTAAYMPPEQATGKTNEAGPTADVYALGATLYRCVTGRPPFQAALAVSLMMAIAIGIPYFFWQQSQLALAKSDQQIQSLKLKEQELATDQANQLAATQEYHATVREVREKRVKPTQGWTWPALDLLQKAAESPAAGKDIVELRSLIAETITTPDFREAGRLSSIPGVGSMAISRDRRFLAIGDWKGVPNSNLTIYEIVYGQSGEESPQVSLRPYRVCSLFTLGDKAKSEMNRVVQGLGFAGKKIENEGIHGAAFSPDGCRVAVGTRNGRIISWNVESEPPQELFNVAPADAVVDGMHKIVFSPDGTTIYAHWHRDDHRSFQSFNAETGETRFSVGKNSWDFSLLPDGQILLSEPDSVDRMNPADLTETVSLGKHDGRGDTWVSVATDRPLMLVSQRRIVLSDPVTGQGGIVIDARPGLIGNLHLAGDSSIICGGILDPASLVVWDGLRGNILHEVSIAGNEWPRIVVDDISNHIFVAESESVAIYEVRSPASDTVVILEKDKLATSPMPQSVIAPGSQPVLGFDLSPDGDHLAMLDLAGEFSRTRVRKINTVTGQEVHRWVCAALADPATKISGTDVAVLGTGEKIAFASAVPGNLIVASENGFEVPSGLGIDVPTWPVTSAQNGEATWKSQTVPEEDREYTVAVAIRFPRPLLQSKELVTLDLTINGEKVEYSANDQIIESSGWFLLSLGRLSPENRVTPWEVKARLTANGLTFGGSSSAEPSNAGFVYPGNIYLFPVSESSGTELQLGTLSGLGDGGLSSTVRKSWLHQWNSDLGTQTAQPWQDFINSQEDVAAVSAAYDQILVGSDSGLVVLLDKDGKRRLLQDGERASTNTQDRITAAAITRNGDFGAAGTYGGRLMFYDLISGQNAPAFSTNAHARALTAISLDNTGRLVATAAEDGALRIWKRHSETLELVFEMTIDSTPIQKMHLSPNGEFLYLLRKGERGVRRLNIAELMRIFEKHGL